MHGIVKCNHTMKNTFVFFFASNYNYTCIINGGRGIDIAFA